MIDIQNIIDFLQDSGRACDEPWDTYDLAELIFNEITTNDPTHDELEALVDAINTEVRESMIR